MEHEWLPEAEQGEVALEAEQGALAESPGVTRRRREMQAFARSEAPPPSRQQTSEAEPVALQGKVADKGLADADDIAEIKRMLNEINERGSKKASLMAGANLFGFISAVLTCVVLGIVATRGGDVTKKTTNNAAAAGTTTTLSIPDFLKGYEHYGTNPCIDSTGQAPLRADLGDVDCEDASTGAQSATDVTKGAPGTRDPALAPIADYNDMGMCTVNVHWHIGAEHRTDTSHKARLPAETAPPPTPPHRWCRHAEATADVSTALDRLLAR